MRDHEKLYDLIYAKADKLLKQYNPCNIRVENNVLVCNNENMCERSGESLCCGDCEYLGENGCTTKCLACKVGMCWAGDNMQYTIYVRLGKNLFNLRHISYKFINQMDRLQKVCRKYRFNKVRMSKEELFSIEKERYSLFYWRDN